MTLTRVQCRGKVPASSVEQGICSDGKNMQALRAYCGGGECLVYMPEVRKGLYKNRCGLPAKARGGKVGSSCKRREGAAKSGAGGAGGGDGVSHGVIGLVSASASTGNAAGHGRPDVWAGVLPDAEIFHRLDSDQLGLQSGDAVIRLGRLEFGVVWHGVEVARIPTLLTRRCYSAYANPAVAKSAAGFGDPIGGGHTAISAVFLCPEHGKPVMGGPCGSPSGLPVSPTGSPTCTVPSTLFGDRWAAVSLSEKKYVY